MCEDIFPSLLTSQTGANPSGMPGYEVNIRDVHCECVLVISYTSDSEATGGVVHVFMAIGRGQTHSLAQVCVSTPMHLSVLRLLCAYHLHECNLHGR